MPKRSYAVESHLLMYFWKSGPGTRPAFAIRCKPMCPVPMWKPSSLSMGPIERASGANADVESMFSWNFPSRSTNSVYVKKSTQLSTSTLKDPSNRLLSNDRRSRSFRASILPVSPKLFTSRWHICHPCRISSTMIRQTLSVSYSDGVRS